mgnify:CR=1 FL=1
MEKKNNRESDNGNVPPPSAPFSLCFLLPSPHHHHSLSLLALSTHCHHQPLYCFCCFKPTAPRETSRDLETQCLPASQPVQIQVVRRSAPSAATTESSFSLAVLQICVLSCAFLLLHRYATAAAAAMTTCTSKQQQQQRCNPPS